MQRFIARQNIERFRRLLSSEREPAQRERLEQLLAEAIAQLDQAEHQADGFDLSANDRPARELGGSGGTCDSVAILSG